MTNQPDSIRDKLRAGRVDSVTAPRIATSVLTSFDAIEVGQRAAIEARSRQHHLPPISLYRWWARRTEAVSGALIDATSQRMQRPTLTVADPFAGGGVIALAALIRDHQVIAQEIDPWAARNLANMLSGGHSEDLDVAFDSLLGELDTEIGYYRTTTTAGESATMSHTLRVAVGVCTNCSNSITLLPGALVSRTTRIDTKNNLTDAWQACRAGHLHKHELKQHPCPLCDHRVRPNDRYTTGRVAQCVHCRTNHPIGELMTSGVIWKPLLVERATVATVEIGEPTADELELITLDGQATSLGRIPEGKETQALKSFGFADFADLYPTRQRAVIDAALAAIERLDVSMATSETLRSAIIGTTEFAGYATRWDPHYLKPYETIASHRYGITTLSAEICPLGPADRGRGTLRKRVKAAGRAFTWLSDFGAKTVQERQSDTRRTRPSHSATVVVGSSERIPVPNRSVELILTDPPYHDDVQYAELASLFRAWSGHATGRLAGDATARNASTQEMSDFENSLKRVFIECARIVTEDGHLILSFANRSPEAWVALFNALQAAGWFAVGFDVVVSENAFDHAKSGRRTCNRDVILDLVLNERRRRHRPRRLPEPGEEEFCFVIGDQALKIGRLDPGWVPLFVSKLSTQEFLSLVA